LISAGTKGEEFRKFISEQRVIMEEQVEKSAVKLDELWRCNAEPTIPHDHAQRLAINSWRSR
jgi:hypothetical protein